MRVLFCGDRHWNDPTPIQRAFDTLDVTVCIHGGASGADTLADREAKLRGIPVQVYLPVWEQFGRAAGPIRNQQMIDEGKPELVVAFHENLKNSKGTKNMLKLAEQAGIPTQHYV